MKMRIASVCALVVGLLIFPGCQKDKPNEHEEQVVEKQGTTDAQGTVLLEVGDDQVSIEAVDANTGEPLAGINIRVVNSEGRISVIGSDPTGQYLPQFAGGTAGEGEGSLPREFDGEAVGEEKGVLSIVLRFIQCTAMYYQEVISGLMTENYDDAIVLLLSGGTVEHSNEIELGYLGQSFAVWGALWAADEIVTIFLTLPTGGLIQVASWIVLAQEITELAIMESMRGYYYAQGYTPEDLFVEKSMVYATPLGLGCVHRFLTIEPVGEPSGSQQATGNITMTLKDATSGQGVSGAKVTITPGTGEVDHFFSNSQGGINASNILPCEHTLTIEHQDYQTRSLSNITVNSNQTTNCGDISLNPIGYSGSGRIRFVLTWGEYPSDLDLHLWYIDGSNDEHFYFGHKGDENIFPYVGLDVDDVTSYGPETMTVSQLVPGATYFVAVHEYSPSSYLPSSGAAIDIFTDTQGQIAHRPVPSGSVGDRWYWYVLTMDGYGNISYDDTFHGGPPRGQREDFVPKDG
jgi:hypothetical protein